MRRFIALALLSWWLIGAYTGRMYGAPYTTFEMYHDMRVMYHNNYGNPGEALLCEEEDY